MATATRKISSKQPEGAKVTSVELRHLYSRERPRKGWLRHERGLVNLNRKLSPDERMRFYIYGERLALACIRRRLKQARLRSRRARNG